MMMCNCSLAGTSACENCTYYKMYSGVDIPYITGISYGYRIIPYYDSDKYELVEKKDWKLNQLKKQLEEKKQSTEYYSKVIDKEINYLAELNKEIEQLESEINQLEE